MTDSLKTEKALFRRRVLAMREEKGSALLAGLGEEIEKALKALDVWKRADKLCIYVSMPKEVETRGLIRSALREGKQVFVPKISDQEMLFYRIGDLSQLHRGYRGIMEPGTDGMPDAGGGLMILPGTAFDVSGGRLGYGGGFYDRYLAKHPDYMTVALSYDFAVFQKIPAESFDRKADMIVTDRRIIRIIKE